MTAAVPAGERLTTEAVRALSKLRGERIVHGAGVAMTARLTLTSPLGLLQPGEHTCTLRVSRSLGLRHWDIHGWALRIPHAPNGPQDLLLDSVAGTRKLRRHLLWPYPGPLAGPSSSITHCLVDGKKVTIVALPVVPQKASLEEMKHMVALKKARWWLLAPKPVGIIEGLEVVGDGRWIDFEPSHVGAGIYPLGLVERIRHGSYSSSRQVEDAAIPAPQDRAGRRRYAKAKQHS